MTDDQATELIKAVHDVVRDMLPAANATSINTEIETAIKYESQHPRERYNLLSPGAVGDVATPVSMILAYAVQSVLTTAAEMGIDDELDTLKTRIMCTVARETDRILLGAVNDFVGNIATLDNGEYVLVMTFDEITDPTNPTYTILHSNSDFEEISQQELVNLESEPGYQ